MSKKSKSQRQEEMVARDKAIIKGIWRYLRETIASPRFFGVKILKDVEEMNVVMYEYLLMAFVNHELGMKEKGYRIPTNLMEHNVRDRIKGKGADVYGAYCQCPKCCLRSEDPDDVGYYCTALSDLIDGKNYRKYVCNEDGCGWGIPKDQHE